MLGTDATMAPQLRNQSGFDSLVEHQGVANSFPELFSNLMLAQLKHLWRHELAATALHLSPVVDIAHWKIMG
jgi:hypothetical protein